MTGELVATFGAERVVVQHREAGTAGAGRDAEFHEGDPAAVRLPLGAAGLVRSQAAFDLAPGAGFLLYTDGLVERRTEPIDAGLDRLLAAVSARAGSSPGQLVASLPEVLLEPNSADDDVCLLGFRLTACA